MKIIDEKGFIDELEKIWLQSELRLPLVVQVLAKHSKSLPKKKKITSGVGYLDPNIEYNKAIEDCEKL